MGIETQATDGENRLTRAGELTLAGARQLRADLLERLQRGGPVAVGLERVMEVDLWQRQS